MKNADQNGVADAVELFVSVPISSAFLTFHFDQNTSVFSVCWVNANVVDFTYVVRLR